MSQPSSVQALSTSCLLQAGQFSSSYFCRSIRCRNADGSIEADLFPPAAGEPFWVGAQYRLIGAGRWRVMCDLRFVTDNFGDLVPVAQ